MLVVLLIKIARSSPRISTKTGMRLWHHLARHTAVLDPCLDLHFIEQLAHGFVGGYAGGGHRLHLG